jgi:hypothetical protein
MLGILPNRNRQASNERMERRVGNGSCSTRDLVLGMTGLTFIGE